MAKESIIEHGGEGVILRKIYSMYEPGKSDQLIKLKASSGDKEALVIGIGHLGDIKLKLPDGVTFTVPSESVHVSGIKMGEIVSFSYETHSRREVPINPLIYRVRTDLVWEDVVLNSFREPGHTSEGGFSAKPQHYWSIKNMRVLFEECAKQNNLDPQVSATWYRLGECHIRAMKGGETVLRKFNGYVPALVHLFPDVTFDTNHFHTAPRHKWSNVANRRAFFERFAQENGFDPLIAQSWGSIQKEQLLATKGARGVLRYHKNNLTRAFHDLFGFKVRFNPIPQVVTENSTTQFLTDRNFFISYANANNFDPLIAKNWYTLKSKMICKLKGRSSLVASYGGIYKALLHLFPDIGLDKSRFKADKSRGLWDKKNQQAAFDQFAQKNAFDPLKPNNWYHITAAQLQKTKLQTVVRYYRRFCDAVATIYPDIGIDKSKFHTWPADSTTNKEHRLTPSRVMWTKEEERKLLAVYPFARYIRDSTEATQRISWSTIANQVGLKGRDANAIREKYKNFKKEFDRKKTKKLEAITASNANKTEVSIDFLGQNNQAQG
eukprot:Phypoly_transcript_04288.p1 GENE.Phypoly_transcript_04288~~Phypoly_transcript_04288.p1  ORF type:complete len:615 (+),score=69.63 Phypoly_transcript_04288:198-1847(+)